MTPENVREFEKAAKSITKMKGNEILFADDATGKMKFIYEAYEDEAALRKSAQDVLLSEEGGKHLVRALNNVKVISHVPAMRFVQVVYETVRKEWDVETRVIKCQQVLDAIGESFDGECSWLDAETEANLDQLKDDATSYLSLWSSWVGANLRSVAKSSRLIDLHAKRRLPSLTKPVFNQLVRTMNDEEEGWEFRAAAMYALIGARAMRLEEAHSFIEAAYTAFPLESLAGIEALAIGIEFDAVAYAELETISEKLAQVRHDHLILREMSRENFIASAKALFETQADYPDEAVEVAVQLQALDKNERMMTTILIDDARRNDFIQMSLKFQVLKDLARVFFAHFVAENPLCRNLSQAIVMALAENQNADAMMVDAWMDACDNAQVDALKSQLEAWKAFLG